MRLLSHNLLVCNAKNCDKNNFPLKIFVQKSQINETEFKPEALQKLIPKLDWPALYQTVVSLGNKDFPENIQQNDLNNEEFLKNLHRILMETHINDGQLICQNCNRQYPIINGIPNMILNDNEI